MCGVLFMDKIEETEDEINEGIKNVKQILAENYVRPDEAQKIISKIRETDARCKGIGNGGASSEELFSELIHFILH